MKYFFLFLIIYGCGSRKDGTINFKKVSGISASNMEGGVVLFASDGIEKLVYTFGSGQEFIDATIVVPDQREWRFRVYAWEGNAAGGVNPNFQGNIRCGELLSFISGGNTTLQIDLTNNHCFANRLTASSNTEDTTGPGSPQRKFKPINVISCKDMTGITSYTQFTSSTCNNDPDFGESLSYRAIVAADNFEPGVGLPYLESNCVTAFVGGSTNDGSPFSNFNLPFGYNYTGSLYRGWGMSIATFKNAACTGDPLRIIEMAGGVGKNVSHFFDDGSVVKSVVKVDNSKINYIFEDAPIGDIPTIIITGTDAVNNYINFNEDNSFNFQGTCSPDGSDIHFWHKNNGTWNQLVSVDSCLGGLFDFDVDMSASPPFGLGITVEFSNSDTIYNEFEVQIVHPNGNVSNDIKHLGRDITAPLFTITSTGCNSSPAMMLSLTDAGSGVDPTKDLSSLTPSFDFNVLNFGGASPVSTYSIVSSNLNFTGGAGSPGSGQGFNLTNSFKLADFAGNYVTTGSGNCFY